MESASLLLQGPVGQIEATRLMPGSTHYGLAVIAHPHPVHGGTMTNKVVTTLARLCRDLGLICYTFNFRGVGLSEGSYDHAIGEQEDLRAVIAFAQQNHPQLPLWLAGFSFGAYISATVAQTATPDCLISICPPISHDEYIPNLSTCIDPSISICNEASGSETEGVYMKYMTDADSPRTTKLQIERRRVYQSLYPPTCPWFIVQTDDDEVVDATQVKAWVDTLQPKPTLITLPDGGHFFHGRLLVLRDKLGAALTTQFSSLCLRS